MKFSKKCSFLILLAIFLSSLEFGFLVAQEASIEEVITDAESVDTEDDEFQPVTAPTPLIEIKRLESDEPLYSIELRNVWVADLFRVIAHDYDLNIIIDQDISNQQNMAQALNDPSLITKITASFTNITLEEALESLAESADLILYKKNNIIRVSSNLATEIFHLRYIDASLLIPVDEDGATNEDAPKIVSNIFELLSSKGRVLFGSEPNSIMVTDFPKNLKDIRDYLEIVDVEPRQVLIEARFAEVSLRNEHALGINWFLLQDSIANFGEFNLFDDVNSDGVQGATESLRQAIPYKATILPGSTTDEENPFSITILNEDIRTVIQTLANQLDTNVLSAPKIATVNNRFASIEIVQSVPWAEPEVSVDDNFVTITWTIHFEEVGISLKVKPIISDDDNIILELNPSVSEQTDTFELTVSQDEINVDYIVPIIDRRETSTKVVIGNKKTLVIGGLIKDQIIKQETKVPFFGDIPFLGRFFKSTLDIKNKIELLILVSPTIINNEVITQMEKDGERINAHFGGRAQAHIDLPQDSMLYKKYDSLEAMYEILKAEREELGRSIVQEKGELKRIERRIKRRN